MSSIKFNPPAINVKVGTNEIDVGTGDPVARYVVEPYMTIEETEDGALITVTAQGETTQATVYNGPQGQQGEQGIQGPEGKQGPQGEQGIQGEKGQKGDKGDKGDTGAQGPQGEKGPKGDTGATGPQGERGPQGETGPAGTTDYNDLTNKPTIPSKVSQLTNDSGFVDAAGAASAAPVQSVNGSTGDVTVSVPSTAADVGALPDTTKYAASPAVGGNATTANALPYGVVDSSSTRTALTVTIPGITELYDGLCILVKNNVAASNTNCTLDVNGLGAKPIHYSTALNTAITTQWTATMTALFYYDSSRNSGNGAWVFYYGYDSNTNTIGYQVRSNSSSLPMTSIVYRYRLLFTSADNAHFVPATNSTSTNATSSRTVCQDKINPFGRIVYYGTTASVSAGSRPSASALWDMYAFTFGYSFQKSPNYVLTAWKPIYLKCAPQADGSAIIDSTTPFTQTLPSTEDGKIYIFLGVAYSGTAMELLLHHPVYYYKDGQVRPWPGVQPQLPEFDSVADEGKVLKIVNGVPTWVTA